MGNYIRLVVTLTAIAAAASFGLSAVYNATHEITEEYKRLEAESARMEVLPTEGGELFEETVTDSLLDGEPFAYYTAYASEARDEVRGYTFTAYGKGYSSTIETIVGVVSDGSISGVKIISQQETPGLGAKIQEVASQNTLWAVISGGGVDESGAKPWFQEQYRGLRAGGLTVVKSQSEEGILAVTGATISSEAVTGSVRRGLAMLTSTIGLSGAEGAPEGGGPDETGAAAGGSPEPGESTEDTAAEAAGTTEEGE